MFWLTALLALQLQPVSSTEPNRQPQLAAANGTVALVFGSGNSIWLARSRDSGRSFSAPSKVADLPGKMALGRHRGPRVAIAGNTIVVSAIDHASGSLNSWRSSDDGRTWSKTPVVINDHPESAREGLHAMAADAEGRVAVVWLDHRIPGGARLWGALSKDAGATWSKNVMLYESPAGTICECCHPSLIPVDGGEFAVMWRNKLEGSRDFYVMRWRDGKPVSTAAKQGDGTWKLEACPMDGGGIAVSKGNVITAWRREKDVYLFEPGKPEVKLATGQDVALAANAKGAYTIWSAGKAIEGRLPGSSAAVRLAEDGAFPVLLALPDGAVLAAWEASGSVAMHRLE